MTPNHLNMSQSDMAEIKAFIREVGEELAGTVATSKMEAIARAHIREEFRSLMGIDTTEIAEVRTFMANMAFLHRFRSLSEKVGAAIILTIVTVATGGLITLVWNSMGNSK